jgi:hypothetical protein
MPRRRSDTPIDAIDRVGEMLVKAQAIASLAQAASLADATMSNSLWALKDMIKDATHTLHAETEQAP